MTHRVDWSKYFHFEQARIAEFQEKFGVKKVFSMGLMPIRGQQGFRELDYEFAEKGLNVKEIMNKLDAAHINILGVVIKDTDGACMWNTKAGWNPTGRDILGEFCDAAKDYNLYVMASFTSMNDAYQGAIHPERVSVHGKEGTFRGIPFKTGEISTHYEGEMRLNLPKEISIEAYKKKIPFLTDKFDEGQGKARGSRGRGYVPLTSFMCPNSEHVDYLLKLTEEVVKNYPIRSFFADYIRYDGSFTDLCACERCQKLFREKYGSEAPLLTSKQWYDFKEDTIASYGQKLHDKIKSTNKNCISGWFLLPGPKNMFTRKRIAQNWPKLSSILDMVSPMEYPYLTGTWDDGLKWGMLADIMYWYFIRNMKKRAHEIKSPALTVTNSVECNAQEMLKQMRGFDFGFGIAVFQYFGTKEEQWAALKKYAEEELGLENLKLK